MTPAELLAREILRLDALGGRDTENDPGFDHEAWPSGVAVRVALRIAGEQSGVANRFEQVAWDPRRAA